MNLGWILVTCPLTLLYTTQSRQALLLRELIEAFKTLLGIAIASLIYLFDHHFLAISLPPILLKNQLIPIMTVRLQLLGQW
jgi:hypothetical protein